MRNLAMNVGSFRARSCQGVDRRTFVRAAMAAPFVGTLPGLADALARAAERSHAKSILLLWLGGGVSHLDTFDPKPKATADYRGPLASIETKIPGVRFSELLPRMAKRSDRFSLVRSNVNFNGGHRPAGSIALTGSVASDGGEDAGGAPGNYPPNFGSIAARALPAGQLPGFISLARGPVGDGVGPIFGYGGGTWGKAHDPFRMNCDEHGAVSIPDLELLEGLTPARLADRELLQSEITRVRRQSERRDIGNWDALSQQAFTLLTSGRSLEALDLSQESQATREAYGQTSFGQSCLLGRRLVEAGVPYVQVNWSQYVEVFYPFSDYGWDTHADNFGLLAQWHCPLLDWVYSTLLDDLQDRGLLESTLLVALTEFGRTPRINSIGSRDHWHHCYFSIWAGGGIQPGRVVGESDPRGEHPATEPITPGMVGATMLEQVGVTSQVRAELKVLEGSRVIHELL